MASLSIPHSFTNNTVASATEVNANFASIKSFGESAVVQVDGSVQAGPSAIATNAITSIKILDGAVTSSKIQDETIVLGDLAIALRDFLVPTGTITAFGSATAPAGWLLCNGQSTSGYAALASVVGANVPDLQGRTIIGTGSGAGLTARTIKDTGGVETVTLTAAQSGLRGHGHGITDPSHTHNTNRNLNAVNVAQTAGSPYIGIGPDANWNVASSTTGVTVNTSDTLDAASSHNNMQPFYALNYIIKH